MNVSKRLYAAIAGGLVVLLVVLAALFAPRGEQGHGERISSRDGAARYAGRNGERHRRARPLARSSDGFCRERPIAALNVRQGDHVQANQVLATLDTRALEYQLAQAEANLAAAQAKADQLKSPAPAEVTAAQASVASAEAALAQLRTRRNLNDMLMAKSDLEKAKAAMDRAQATMTGSAVRPTRPLASLRSRSRCSRPARIIKRLWAAYTPSSTQARANSSSSVHARAGADAAGEATGSNAQRPQERPSQRRCGARRA